jgi:hypothetical protein
MKKAEGAKMGGEPSLGRVVISARVKPATKTFFVALASRHETNLSACVGRVLDDLETLLNPHGSR